MTFAIPPPPPPRHAFIFHANLSGPPSESFQSFLRSPLLGSQIRLIPPKIPSPPWAIRNDRPLKALHTTDLSHGLLLFRVLENITGYIINIDDINYYKDENGKYDYDR